MTLPGPADRRDVRTLLLLLLAMFGLALWAAWDHHHLLTALAGIPAGIVLGRLLEPLVGARVRTRVRPDCTVLTVQGVNFLSFVLNRFGAEPVSVLLLGAVTVLVLGNGPWDGLRRFGRRLADRLARTVTPAAAGGRV